MHFKPAKLAAAFIIPAGIIFSSGCSKIKTTSTSDEPSISETTAAAESSNVTAEESIFETENTNINTEQSSSLLESDLSFNGRHLFKNDIQWLVQSGSSAGFNVTGTKASITIAGDRSVSSSSELRPRYAVYLDGELIHDKVISENEENIVLFEESSKRTAEVKVILLSEAKYGAVGIKAINVTGGNDESITPIEQKDLAIEFIGDSITCGFGVDAADGSDPFSTATENFCHSYAYTAAQKLNADYSVAAYSGYGVISGYSSGEKNSEETVPQYYDIAGRYSGYDEAWDFSQRKMDAVVINLGTNDTCYVNSDDEQTCNEFIEEYKNFLETVLERNPDAVIICTVGLMGGEGTIYPLIEKAVSEINNDRVSCFLSPKQDMELNGAGACWHPSEKTQYEYGLFMAEKINEALENK